MNALYTFIQLIPLAEIVLRLVLYVAAIYILLGPLRQLIKSASSNLAFKKSNFDDVVITCENLSDNEPSEVSLEDSETVSDSSEEH